MFLQLNFYHIRKHITYARIGKQVVIKRGDNFMNVFGSFKVFHGLKIKAL